MNINRTLSKGIISVLFVLALSASIAAAVPFTVGNVFAGVGAGKINEYTPTGTLVQTLDSTSGSSEQTGMCFDASNNLYGTSFEANSMEKFNSSGFLIKYPWGGPFNADPESCVVNAAGNVYVGQADGTHKILEFDPTGTTLLGNWTPITDRGTDWIDLAADQKTVFYNSESGTIRRFDVSTPSGTQLSDFATGLSGPCYALRIRTNGEVMSACTNQVYRLNNTGGIIQTYPKPATETSILFAMNLDRDGTSFWTAGFNTGHVYKIDIATGNILSNFTATPLGPTVAGLAVLGEITVSRPSLGSISGTKYNDLNSSGTRDAGEPGLANWTITLTNSTGSVVTKVTDVNGSYSFTNLTDGNYTVGEVKQSGWNQTAPVTGNYTVIITGGSIITGKDFGNVQASNKCDKKKHDDDKKKLDDDKKKLDDNKKKLDDDNKKLGDDKKKYDDDKKKLDNDIKKKAGSKTIADDNKKLGDDKKKYDDNKKKYDDNKKKYDDDKKKYDDNKKKYDDDDKKNKCNYDKKKD
jgi:hypothetical protein